MLLAGLSAGVSEGLAEHLPGVRIATAADLPSAVGRLERPWGVVVVDHDLPGGGGVELVRELRVNSWGRTVPVLFCIRSNLPVEIARHLVDSLKVSGLLFHPVHADSVAERITALLPARDAAAPIAPPAPAFATALAGSWAKFRGVTLERVATLEEAAAALLAGKLDAELRRRAERDAHKLAGSVGTFGFARGSELARAVELQLEGDGPLQPADARVLRGRVQQLRQQLERRPGPREEER